MATEISADTPESSAAASDASSSSFWRSVQRAQSAVHSLAAVLGPLPDPHLAFSDDPATALLRDPAVSAAVSCNLRLPSSGAGDDHLCRWLYDTFHSAVPALRLAVLSFLPALAGAYLSRSSASPSRTPSGPRHPLAGFEAVLLALYAHETVRRGGEPEAVTLPSLAAPSVYHEVRPPSKKAAAEADDVNCPAAVVSPALEPHGTVRSTRRARIVGVALELYYSSISQIPDFSKLEFCEFCVAWSGQGVIFTDEKQGSCSPASASQRSDFEGAAEEGKRIPLPWELFQPMLRIVGHCLLGPGDSAELRTAAYKAAQCLHARAVRELDSPAAVLASRSLVRLGKIAAAETEMTAEEVGTEAKTAASEVKEPATEAATEVKTPATEAEEPAKETEIETKTAETQTKEPATEAATKAKTAPTEAKEPATEGKDAATEAKDPATEAAAEAKTAPTNAKGPATEAKEAATETKEPATEAPTEAKTAPTEAKEPATEAATEAKTAPTDAKEPATEAEESATEAKEPATEAATEAKTAASDAKEPATEGKESASEVKEPASPSSSSSSSSTEESSAAAEANRGHCSELESTEADARSP